MARQQYKQPRRDLPERDSGMYQDEPGDLQTSQPLTPASDAASDFMDSSEADLAEAEAFRQSIEASQLEDLEDREDQEEASAAEQEEADALEVDDTLGNGYTGEGPAPAKSGLRGKFSSMSRTKKILVLGAIPGMGTAALIAILVFMSGPLQIIHAAQLLRQYHFGAVDSFIEDRTARIYRYYKWQNKPQNRRLSRIGNALADRIDADYKKAGMDTQFDKDGVLSRIRVDNSKFSAQELDAIKKGGLAAQAGVGTNGGFTDIDIPKNMTGTQGRILYKNTRRSLGLVGHGGFIQARLAANRVSPSIFHPIKRMDESIIRDAKAARAKWEERKKTIIPDGTPPSVRAPPPTQDAQGNTLPSDSAPAAGALDGIGGTSGTPAEARAAGARTKIGGGLAVAGGVNMVTGIVCMIYTIANVASDIEYQNVVKPSMAAGGYIMGLGSQFQSGQDIQEQQIGFENDKLFDESDDGDDTTLPNSFFEAESLQTEAGRPNQGVKTPDSARLGGSTNLLSKLQENNPEMGKWILSKGCGVVNSPIGMALTFGIDLYLAPASAVVGVGASLAAGPLLDNLAKVIAGAGIDYDLKGAVLGAVANQGAKYLADQQFLTAGATPLSEPERLQVKADVESERKYYAQQAPWFERYLNPKNANSVAGNLARERIPEPSKALANILNIPKSLFSTSSKLFGAKVSAQEPVLYDYGLPKFAYRPSELAVADSDESFRNPYENAAVIESQVDDLHAKYSEKCFGLKFDADEKFEIKELVNMKKLAEDPGLADCRSKDETMTRYRFYIGDLMAHATTACYLGDEEICKELRGAGAPAQAAPAVANSGTPTSGPVGNIGNLECPPDATKTPHPQFPTYFKLPDAPGVYTIYSREARRYGQKELICTLYTAGKAYKQLYGARSTLDIGDLNAAGHKSHKWGVGVDLDAQGEVVAADNQNVPAKYSPQATTDLGKAFVSTGMIKNIWYCEPGSVPKPKGVAPRPENLSGKTGSMNAIRDYAKSIGKPVNIYCLSGHYNHFHIDINTPHGPVHTP